MSNRGVLTMFVCMILFVCGVLTGITAERYEFQIRAVKAGVAQFNPKTATFEWITPKEPERDYALEVHNEMIMNRLNSQKCE